MKQKRIVALFALFCSSLACQQVDAGYLDRVYGWFGYKTQVQQPQGLPKLIVKQQDSECSYTTPESTALCDEMPRLFKAYLDQKTELNYTQFIDCYERLVDFTKTLSKLNTISLQDKNTLDETLVGYSLPKKTVDFYKHQEDYLKSNKEKADFIALARAYASLAIKFTEAKQLKLETPAKVDEVIHNSLQILGSYLPDASWRTYNKGDKITFDPNKMRIEISNNQDKLTDSFDVSMPKQLSAAIVRKKPDTVARTYFGMTGCEMVKCAALGMSIGATAAVLWLGPKTVWDRLTSCFA